MEKPQPTVEDLREYRFTPEQHEEIRGAFLAWCQAKPDKDSPLILGPSRPITAGAVLEAAAIQDPWLDNDVLSMFRTGIEPDSSSQVAHVVEALTAEAQAFLAADNII
jgi:hypothetical protein